MDRAEPKDHPTAEPSKESWLPITENKLSFINAMNADQHTHTASTFQEAVSKGKILGTEKEVDLEIQMRDWLGFKINQPKVNADRGTAVLADALGEFRLESGTRLDPTSHADKKDRILKTANYDFGGEAQSWLTLSSHSLLDAEQYVDAHKGSTEVGQLLDDNYKQQLQDERKRVEAKLDIVYGAHDIPAVFAELKEQFKKNPEDIETALLRLSHQPPYGDNRAQAKEKRDLAIGFLAAASHFGESGDNEAAKIFFREGLNDLHSAEKLSGDAPDNQPLEKLQTSIAKVIFDQ